MQYGIKFMQPIYIFYTRCLAVPLLWYIYALPKWQYVRWFVLKKVLLCIAD